MKKKCFNISFYILFGLLFIILIYSITLIYKYYHDKSETKKIETKIKLIEKNNQSDNSIKEDVLTSEDLKQLSNENQDTIAYIKVNNTNIKYPIVQTNNNEYYLNHSFDKSYNSAGWVFMDYRNNKEMNNKNTILYAHGRIDKTMFGSLYKTQYPAWYQNKSNHIIRISTPSVNMSYQIFSVYKIEEESYYIQTDFTSDDVYLEFLNTIKERSKYDFNVVLNESDKIITLSTCANDKERYVVHAKLIKKSARE